MAQIVYKAAINLVKTCILLLYLRIFSKIMWFRGACYFLLAAVGSYCLSATLVTIFQCTPVTKAFHKADPTFEGTCVDNTKFWYANAGFSIATDIIMLLLPMPLVYRLQVPWPQKVALVGVFMLGIFVVITSCLRITSLDILATTPDTSYDIENVMWTIIEPNVAIVCSCLPILRPFIAKLFPALRSRGYYYNSSPYGASAKSGSHAASRNRDSHYPVHSSPRKSGDVRMTTIQRSPSADDGSEEIILQSNRNDTSSGRISDSRERGIQKTVEYSVEYSTH